MLSHFPQPLGHESKKESFISQGAKVCMATVTIAARNFAPWPHQQGNISFSSCTADESKFINPPLIVSLLSLGSITAGH